VDRFPEKNDEDKVKHLYFEYYNNGVNGGEDRHRMFSWTVQPLWGKNLLAFEMQYIPRKMISYKFFVDFLRRLDGRLLGTPIYGSNMRLDSRVGAKLYLAKMRFIEVMVNNRYIPNLYKYIARKFHQNPKIFRSVLNEIQRLCKEKLVSKQFDIAAVEEFLAHSPRIREVYHLLTIMIYVSEVGRKFPQKVKY